MAPLIVTGTGAEPFHMPTHIRSVGHTLIIGPTTGGKSTLLAAIVVVGAMLADCWDRHPLCLAYLDVLHEAWCLLYIPPRDPKMVFAQLDWLTRPLLQAAEVMARETSGCRSSGHREPGQPVAPAVPSWLNGRR